MKISLLKTVVVALLVGVAHLAIAGELTVTYDANGATGNVPVDNKKYAEGDMAFILGTEVLEKQGFLFAGWNTKADGTGEACATDTESSGSNLKIGNKNITLYAQWGKLGKRSKKNLSLNLNGPNDIMESIVLDHMPAFPKALTIEAWIRPTAYGKENESIILKFYGNNDTCIQLYGGDHVLSWCGWQVTGETPIPLNKWTHIAVVLENEKIKAMYVNGKPEKLIIGGSGKIKMPVPSLWVIGNMTWSRSPYRWQGGIDELRAWNGVRTAKEIAENYKKQLQGNEPNLVGYWDFNRSAVGAKILKTNKQIKNIRLLCDQNKNTKKHHGELRHIDLDDWSKGAPVTK